MSQMLDNKIKAVTFDIRNKCLELKLKALICAQYIRFNNCDYCLLRNRPVLTVKKHWTMERKLHNLSKSISLKESNTISTILYILQYSVEHRFSSRFLLIIKNKENGALVISYLVFLNLKTESSSLYSVSFSREVSYFLYPCFTWFSNL